ncbi:MAG: hypothetical protein EAX96_06310 [Candidatus Lokiarchaeota archaeon]|nr:hypothetical protein [Candidatus Lokiarchaeota archaeon]
MENIEIAEIFYEINHVFVHKSTFRKISKGEEMLVHGLLSGFSSAFYKELFGNSVKTVLFDNNFFIAIRGPKTRNNIVYIFGKYKNFNEIEIDEISQKIYNAFIDFCLKKGLSTDRFDGNMTKFKNLTEHVKKSLF